MASLLQPQVKLSVPKHLVGRDINSMSLHELRSICKENGIKGHLNRETSLQCIRQLMAGILPAIENYRDGSWIELLLENKEAFSGAGGVLLLLIIIAIIVLSQVLKQN